MRATTAPSSRSDGNGSRRAKRGSVAALADATSLLRSTPINYPPPLSKREHTDSELFQYYAVRGHVEVFRNDTAVRSALGEVPLDERERACDEMQVASMQQGVGFNYANNNNSSNANDNNNNNNNNPFGGVMATLSKRALEERYTCEASGAMDRGPQSAQRPSESSQPLFPRLRPSAVEDTHAKFLKLRTDAAEQTVKDTRDRDEQLPPVAAYYTSLYRPQTTLGDDISSKLQEELAAVTAQQAAAQSGAARGGSHFHYHPSTDGNAAPLSPSTAAALLRDGRQEVAKELEEAFVAGYYVLHPDAEAKKLVAEEAEKRRQSALAAASNMQAAGGGKAPKKKKAKKKAKKGPVEGGPAENLRFFLSSLLAVCNERGEVSLSEIESVLSSIPFEVQHNKHAVQELFNIVRQVTEYRAPDVAVDLIPPPVQTPTQSHNFENSLSNRSTTSKTMMSMSTQQRVATGTNLGSPQPPSAPQRSARWASTASAADINASSNVAPPNKGGLRGNVAKVLVREFLYALDAIVNGEDTHKIVRWECFNVLASEGQGYIHKATLLNIRKLRREECEGPQAVLSASIVKALLDVFSKIGEEEEEEYIKSTRKGKRKKPKAPVLAGHQKSVIPLHMMRRSHIDFPTFCRFFDTLPQLCAAFTHVWLGLILTGKIFQPHREDSNTQHELGGGGISSRPTTEHEQSPRSGGGGIDVHAATIGSSPRFSNTTSLVGRQSIGSPISASPKLAASHNNANNDVLAETLNEQAENNAGEAAPADVPAAVVAAAPTPAAAAAATTVAPSDVSLSSPVGSEPVIPKGAYPLVLLGADQQTRKARVQIIVLNQLSCMAQGLEKMRQPPAAADEVSNAGGAESDAATND